MAESVRSRRRITALLLTPGLLWLGALFVAPLALVVAVSFASRGQPVEWRLAGDAYRRAIDPLMVGIVLRSLGLGAAATTLCALVGYPLTYFIVRRRPRLRGLLYFLVIIPLAANSLVLIYAWITLLRPTGIIEKLLATLGVWSGGPLGLLYSPLAVLIGLTYWYLPFMVYPVYASMERFDFRLLEAAADLGAGRWDGFRRVLLPQTMPGLATGCLLVFVQTFCSFVVPELLGGSKTLLLGSYIQQRFLSLPQDWPLGAALALALALVTMLGLGLGVWGVTALQRQAG